MSFNWVDIVALVFLARMGYIGFQMGLGTELAKLTGLLAGIVVAFRYYQEVGDALAKQSFLGMEWAAGLTMLVILVVCYLAVSWLLRLLEKVMQVSFQQNLNQIGGLVAGLFRGLLVTSVVWVICQQLPSDYLHQCIREKSFSGAAVEKIAPGVYDGLGIFHLR